MVLGTADARGGRGCRRSGTPCSRTASTSGFRDRGRGDGYPDVALDTVASQTFDGRIQLEYVPKVLTGPPGAREDS